MLLELSLSTERGGENRQMILCIGSKSWTPNHLPSTPNLELMAKDVGILDFTWKDGRIEMELSLFLSEYEYIRASPLT